jgi:excisionase family DNA binding protein
MELNKPALKALDLMTTSDVAKELGVTVRSVQLWVEQGALEGWKTPGGHRRITRASFERFRSGTRPGQPSRPEILLKVVIVEDNKEMQALYELTISNWNMPIELKFIANGLDGMLYISQHIPDLLITDLIMPEMDGYAMLQSLRKTDAFSRMAIIVVTGVPVQEFATKGGLPKGIRLYGKTPVPFWEMRELMQGLIDRKLMEQPSAN